MKKLKLNMEDLKVDSFETTVTRKAHGTVNGNATVFPDPTCEERCPTVYTNPCHTEQHTCVTCHDPTCGGFTCDNTVCPHTCDFSCDAPPTQCA